ncbi:uncharacterized protein SCODWIG_00710 [Saccharomycodes ludwigii]|uniref:Peptidase S59 domain-containing protein n=1 Tax=Saccharomycodes ludwigii TaxID=36035 RepID=A0A376B2X4_9ASCO|nr:uncharacterized protein SCODWIG_00710 [Saccharomycodes ludwigii]
MFNTTSNNNNNNINTTAIGGNLFGNSGLNTSTPQSTPVPRTNVFGQQQQQPPTTVKPTNTLFGNNGIGAASTPSPVTNNLFGTNKPSTGLLNNPTTNTGTNTTNGTSLFGNSSKTMTANIAPVDNKPQIKTGTTGLFGSATMNPSTNKNGGLFNNGNTQTNSLFTNKPTTTNSNSLFGNNSSATSAPISLFGNTNSNNTATGNGNFGALNNSGSQMSNTIPNASSNPYGLKIEEVLITKMPASITSSLNNNTSDVINNQKTVFNIRSKNPTSLKRNSFQSSTFNESSLISKLGSRLLNGKSTDSIRGLFSASSSLTSGTANFLSNFGSFDKNTLDNQQNNNGITKNNKKLAQNQIFFTNGVIAKKDLSGIRKLKIDPKRIALKRQRLANGLSSTSKFGSIEDDNVNNGESSIHNPKDNRKPDSNYRVFGSHELKEDLNVESSGESSNEESSSSSKSSAKPADSSDIDYWCSPSIEALSEMSEKELSLVPDFVIGRKGYGCIAFSYDVDLSNFKEDFKGKLFGNIVVFNDNRTVEVYPDEKTKPTVGNGINVPAIITLEKIYPIDVKTKKPIKNGSNIPGIQNFVKKLKNQRGMEFISYNPFGGVWIFKVKHFSIYGLVDDNSVAVDLDGVEVSDEIKNRNIAYPKMRADEYSDVDLPGAFERTTSNKQQSNTSSALNINSTDIVLSTPKIPGKLLDLVQNEDIVVERDYEPSDVDESDFDDLEVQPDLDTADDWVEQLVLAGTSKKSIFADQRFLFDKNADLDNLLFASFNRNVEEYQKIIKERRLVRWNFASFNQDSTLLIKSVNGIGAKIVTCPAIKGGKDPKTLVNIFTQIIPRVNFETRNDTHGFPIVSKDIGFNFQNLYDANSEDSKWNLLHILFDKMNKPQNYENENVCQSLMKKQKLNRLIEWVNMEISGEINLKLSTYSSKSDNADQLYKIILHLVNNDIVEATSLAIYSNNPHLSCVIPMLTSNNNAFKKMAKLQLSKWKSLGCSVDPQITCIFKILSGDFVYLSDLSWLANFALHLNYCDIYRSSISDVVADFFCHFKIHDVNNQVDKSVVASILKFYTASTGEASKYNELLKALKFSESPLDCVLTWFLIQILSAKHKKLQIDYNIKDIVSLNFIEQLKCNGLWEESMYVATFIENNFVATKQFKNLLTLEIKRFQDNIPFLKKLKIPESELYYHLSLSFKNSFDSYNESLCLIKAGKYKEGIAVITKILGPKCILSSDDKEHSKVLDLIETFPKNIRDSDWDRSIGLYKRYLRLLLLKDSGKDNLETIMDLLPLYYENTKCIQYCYVSCMEMSFKVSLEYIERFIQGESADRRQDLMNKILNLPLGEPEANHLKRLLK